MDTRCYRTSDLAWALFMLVWSVPHIQGGPYSKEPKVDQHIQQDSRQLTNDQHDLFTPGIRDTSRLQKIDDMAELMDLLVAFKQTYSNIFDLISPQDTNRYRLTGSQVDDIIPFTNDLTSPDNKQPSFIADNVLFPSLRRNTRNIVPYTRRTEEYIGGPISIPSKRRMSRLKYGCDLSKVTLNIMIEYLKSGKICGIPISHVRYGLGRK